MTDEVKLKEKKRKKDAAKPDASDTVVSTAGRELADAILDQVSRRIVGQGYMAERVLIGLLTGGHVLLEGVPGLAKTMAIRTIAETIATSFQRIQFTPDLLPADVIGTMIYNQKSGDFEPRRGPVFANIILADEVNRAPAKVQSALLEAMQEKQVTFGGQTFALDEPFLVLATQNPIEQEGTYPLPEAQVDRFMLKVKIDYPSREEEKEIMRRFAGGEEIPVDEVTDPGAIMQARSDIARLYMDDKISDYIVDLVHASRQPADYKLPELVPLIEYGASPRASIYLAQTGRAHAYLRGRGYVIPDDVKAVAPDVFRHRIITTYEAEAEEVTPDEIVRRILEAVEVP
jgi:MoxR-like ATPase